jgi:hypothetical protein
MESLALYFCLGTDGAAPLDQSRDPLYQIRQRSILGYYEVELRGIAGSALILKQDHWSIAKGTNRGENSYSLRRAFFRHGNRIEVIMLKHLL